MLFSPSPKRKRLQLRISERRLLLMVGDTFAIIIAILISLLIWSFIGEIPFSFDFVLPQSYWFFALVAVWLLLANANDYYDLSIAANRIVSFQRLSVITAQMLVVYFIVFFLSPRGELPRLFIVYYGFSSFTLLAFWRLINPALIGWASTARQILIVGADDSADVIIDAIKEYSQRAYSIRGIIGQTDDVGKTIQDIPVVGTGADILNFVIRDRITELIITSVPDLDDDIFRGVMEAYEHGANLIPMPILYERITQRIPVNYVKNNWVAVLPITGQSIFNPYFTLQRIMDIVLSLIGLMFLLILLPFIGLAIKLNSPGRIFYTQTRTGRNGRNFRIIKFRTMIKNAEKATGAVFSQANDPRITKVGRFLRKTRLDEVPQLVNVLRGEMSIVGPRPERPEHIERLTEKIPFYRTRLTVRPGVTGWAQVRYRYGQDDLDAEAKLEYDLYYIRNQSVILDMNIMIRTIGKMLKMTGV